MINRRTVSVYRVSDMQGTGPADVLLYFKGPVTQQIRRHVNAYIKKARAIVDELE